MLEDLSISCTNGKTRIFLTEKEIHGVIGYEIKSSTAGTAELTLKILVGSKRLCFGKQSGDNLSSNLSENA